jgi:hypothetical protein
MTKQSIFLILFLAFVALSVAAAGCSGATPPPSSVAAQSVVSNASDKMQALNSYHFVLDQVGGGTPIAMGIEMKKAEGDVLKPDKLKMSISGTALGFSIQVQLITVGGVIKMTNPLNGQWETLSDQFKILGIFDPTSGIAAILKQVSNLTALDDQQSGGVPCYHLKGNVSSDALNALTGSSVSGVNINVELWIGKGDFLVRTIQLTGKITETEVSGIVRTLSLSNFGQALSIELPQ